MLMSNITGRSLPTKDALNPNSIFRSNSYVGIEIETESTSRSLGDGLESWQVVSEGSVDGYELVLKEPMCGDKLYLALHELLGLSRSLDPVRTFTERTSNHIHIDVSDMTYVQFINFLTLSVMFEQVLYKYVAPHRSNNHFCWSFLDCQSLVDRVKQVNNTARNGSPRDVMNAFEHHFSAGSTKYSGINLSSVSRYGSLEFRMHEGTMDVNAIIRWINILLTMKEYAMDAGRTPENILVTKQEVGIDSIFTAVLGDYRGILTYPGVERDILEGIRSAQDFVYTVTTSEDIDYSVVLPEISGAQSIIEGF